MSTGTDWTVRRVLEWTIGHLQSRGSETPRLDAEVLLAHAWQCPRIQLYTRYDQTLPENVRAAMRELVQRRAAHEPVAYLIGRREFFSLEFETPPGVFIPRPATETLIVEALPLARRQASPRILDLCTGSGCIAVTLARHLPEALVTAVDLNPLAVETARRNAIRHGVEGRLTVFEGDLFGPLSVDAPFDLLVSNPPYVTDGEMPDLPPDVRDHEPRLALAAGPDGLDVVRRIVAELDHWLAPSAAVLLEIAPEQAASTRSLLQETGLFSTVDVIRDMDRNDRIVRGVR